MPRKKDSARKTAHGESMDKKLKFKFTEKQLEIISRINDADTKVVFIDGPAGSSKTILGVYCGLKELFREEKNTFLYIRTAAESGKINIGARPGEVGDKIHHLVGPLRDKLDELLHPNEIHRLIDEANPQIEALPVNDIRGSSWTNKFVVVDEAQNFEFSELLTVITRLGKNSKIIFVGDSMQSDIRQSGWTKFFNMFTDTDSENNGAFSFSLGEEDIVRSEFVRFVIRKVKSHKENEDEWNPGK